MPLEIADRFTGSLGRSLKVEAASGLLLLFAVVAALGLANSPWSATFPAFWETPIGLHFGPLDFSRSLRLWINDGLMTFFFVVALELKRELVLGELRSCARHRCRSPVSVVSASRVKLSESGQAFFPSIPQVQPREAPDVAECDAGARLQSRRPVQALLEAQGRHRRSPSRAYAPRYVCSNWCCTQKRLMPIEQVPEKGRAVGLFVRIVGRPPRPVVTAAARGLEGPV